MTPPASAYSSADLPLQELPLYGPPHIVTESYVVTAYSVGDKFTRKSPGDPTTGITASGARVETDVTAACPHEIPLGTRIIVEGVGERVCADRGGRITGKHVDLYVPTVKEALDFGRQTLEVSVIHEFEL